MELLAECPRSKGFHENLSPLLANIPRVDHLLKHFINILIGQRVKEEECFSYEEDKWQCGPCQLPKPIRTSQCPLGRVFGTFFEYFLDELGFKPIKEGLLAHSLNILLMI